MGDAKLIEIDYTPPIVYSTEEKKVMRETTEQDMKDRGLTAPFVTQEHVDNKICTHQFHQFPGTTVTVCVITLKNGFTTVGQSACASPENFNAELGEKYAYEDAYRQIARFEAYLLCERQSETAE